MSFDPGGGDRKIEAAQRMASEPMIILSDESQRVSDQTARGMNIKAGKAVAESIRTTLGPKGLDKMLVDSEGSVLITNDGVTILDQMDIDHPAADMVVEVAETQSEKIGDGTTSAIVEAGELLSQAEELIDQDLHPSTIAKGFRLASEKAREILKDEGVTISGEDRETLIQVAETAMVGKGVKSSENLLADLVVDSVLSVVVNGKIDTDNVSIVKSVGGSVAESELIRGVIVDKQRIEEGMPRSVDNANIALFDGAIEMKETKVDTEVSATDPDQLQSFVDQEEARVREMVDQIVDVGVDVIFIGGGIHELAQRYLAQEGILAVDQTPSDDLGQLSRATGAKTIGNLDDIKVDELGFARSVAQKDIGGEERIIVEDGGEAQSVTLLARGGTEDVVDELRRAIDDALAAVVTTLLDGKVLPGGGAIESELALRLREYSDSVAGREQLAVEAFGDALEVIPRTIAENAGVDPVDSLVNLRSRHADGDLGAGLNAYTGDVVDMQEEGVVEPLRVKTQAIQSATEAAILILRIDDVIAAGSLAGGKESPESTDTTVGVDQVTSTWSATGVSGKISDDISIGNLFLDTESEDSATVAHTTSGGFDTPRIKQTSEERPSSVDTPSWIPANKPLPLYLSWEGELKEIRLLDINDFDIWKFSPEDAELVRESGDRATIFVEGIGSSDTLSVSLKPRRIPETGIKKQIPIILEYSSGSIIQKEAEVEILRPKVDVDITDRITTETKSRGIDIELRNTGQLRAELDIIAKATGERVEVKSGLGDKLVKGLLNIGIHDIEIESPASQKEVDQSDRKFAKRCCRDVIDKISEGMEPPSGYSSDDLDMLSDNLEKMINRGYFAPLQRFLEDIKLTYLTSTANRTVDENMQLSSEIQAIEVPEEAREISVNIIYNNMGAEYDPVEHQITIDPDVELDGIERFPVNIRSGGES